MQSVMTAYSSSGQILALKSIYLTRLEDSGHSKSDNSLKFSKSNELLRMVQKLPGLPGLNSVMASSYYVEVILPMSVDFCMKAFMK